MKRIFVVLAVFLLLLVTASGCSTKDNTSAPSGDTSSVSQIPQFAVATRIQTRDCQNLTYTGGELRIPYRLRDQSETDAQWGLEIMLDGVLQDFLIEDGTDRFAAKRKLHAIPMKQGETKNITLVFTPNIGKKGQELNLNICTILNPEYMPNNLFAFEFRPNHNLNGGLGARLTMQQSAPQQTEISDSNMKESALTEKQKKPYINDSAVDASGNTVTINELEQRLILQLFQKDPDEKNITITTGQSASLTVSCFGKPGTYRISVYVNHEPQPVFEGSSYLEVTVEQDKAYVQTISINLDKLSGKNHVYAVAAPIHEKDTTSVWYLEKTPSKFLIKQAL